MDSTLKLDKIEIYSRNFCRLVTDDFFNENDYITGNQILELTSIRQINLFIVWHLFAEWKNETANIQSPYFDYNAPEVKNAFKNMMNVLSKNIKMNRDTLESLLEKAITQTILLAFFPIDYFKNELLRKNEILVSELQDLNKYIKINTIIYDAWLLKIEKIGKDKITKEEGERAFDEVIKDDTQGPDDADDVKLLFEQVLPLNLDDMMSEEEVSSSIMRPMQGQPAQVTEADSESKKMLHEKLSSEKKKTLADDLQHLSIKDIRNSLSLNQKFMFIKELFENDTEKFDLAITKLDSCSSQDEAMEYLSTYNWDVDKEEVAEFVDLVQKRFPD